MSLDETEESYGLEELHKELLKQILVFDKICRENNIEYSLHAGTLLGAIRNGKLIPWDDDIDITMTRNHYSSLVKIFDENTSEFMIDFEETWVPRVKKRNHEGLDTFIDIFIYDGITKNKLLRNIKFTLTRFLQGTVKEDTDYTKFGFLNRILLRTTALLGKPFSKKTKISWINYVCEKMFTGDGSLINRSNDRFQAINIIHDKVIMEDYSDVILENLTLRTTRFYDDVLRASYGDDYLIPPPKEDRIPQHLNIIKKEDY